MHSVHSIVGNYGYGMHRGTDTNQTMQRSGETDLARHTSKRLGSKDDCDARWPGSLREITSIHVHMYVPMYLIVPRGGSFFGVYIRSTIPTY